MKLKDLYSRYILDYLSSGSLILRHKISAIGIKPTFDRILTKKYVTKVWNIVGVPVDYYENLTELIRIEMTYACPNVRTMVQIINSSTNVNVQSELFVKKLNAEGQKVESYKELFENLSDGEKITGKAFHIGNGRKFFVRKQDLNRIQERSDSYNYVYKHSTGGGEFFHTHIHIFASADNNKDLAKYRKILGNLLTGKKIRFREITGSMTDFVSNFGPATYIKGNDKKYPYALMSDENLATMVPYRTHGLVGGTGALLGLDLLSKFPLMLDFYNSTTAQVIMVIAKAGKGKTLLAQLMALSFLGQKVHVNATDIKGGEWSKLGFAYPVLVIAMDDVSGRFVNTMRIDDIEVSREDALYIYNVAVQGTLQLLNIIIRLLPDEGNPVDLEGILKEAIDKVYSKRGVNRHNPKSFKKAKGVFYDEILEPLMALSKSSSYTQAKRELCELAYDRLATFFKNAKHSGAMKNEVTLAEVIDAPLVSYSYNKNSETTLSLMDNIRVYMGQFLSIRKQVSRKAKGLHTADIYEELQRTDQFANLLTNISHATTGGRSNNLLVMLLLNALSVFDNPQAKAIASNITTVIAGELADQDYADLDRLGFGRLIPDLKKLSKTDIPLYKNAFAIYYDTGVDSGQTIFKAMPPKHIEEKLRTRDVVG